MGGKPRLGPVLAAIVLAALLAGAALADVAEVWACGFSLAVGSALGP